LDKERCLAFSAVGQRDDSQVLTAHAWPMFRFLLIHVGTLWETGVYIFVFEKAISFYRDDGLRYLSSKKQQL
jgi:hypothetical protein